MNHAQADLVRKSLDWDLVSTRLSQYPQIAKVFPIYKMRGYSDKPPYYCHYLAWRLGTWAIDDTFKKLDDLLGVASTLPGWEGRGSVFWEGDYGAFWSVLWELQVACGLHRAGRDVTWTSEGPDLLVVQGSDQVFVECYVYRKRFAPLEFFEELLQKVDPNFRVEYTRGVPIEIPHATEELDDFLHSTIEPLSDAERIRSLQEQARIEYPVLIPAGVRNLCIYMTGNDPDKYRPGRTPFFQGEPATYLDVCIKEAMSQKARRNDMGRYRPNILLVNFLLSRDFQSSIVHAATVPSALPSIELDTALDCMILCVAGIDQEFGRSCLVRRYFQEGQERLLALLCDGGLQQAGAVR